MQELNYMPVGMYIKNKWGGFEHFVESTKCTVSPQTLRKICHRRQKDITLSSLKELARCLEVPLGKLTEELAEWIK